MRGERMKNRRKVYIVLSMVALLVCGVSGGVHNYKKLPKQILKDITAEKVSHIYVRVGELGRYELTEEEKEAVFSALSQLKIHKKQEPKNLPTGTSYFEFIIIKKNGKQVVIKPVNSLLLIDHESYWLERESYKHSQELGDFMTELGKEYQAQIKDSIK